MATVLGERKTRLEKTSQGLSYFFQVNSHNILPHHIRRFRHHVKNSHIAVTMTFNDWNSRTSNTVCDIKFENFQHPVWLSTKFLELEKIFFKNCEQRTCGHPVGGSTRTHWWDYNNPSWWQGGYNHLNFSLSENFCWNVSKKFKILG